MSHDVSDDASYERPREDIIDKPLAVLNPELPGNHLALLLQA